MIYHRERAIHSNLMLICVSQNIDAAEAVQTSGVLEVRVCAYIKILSPGRSVRTFRYQGRMGRLDQRPCSSFQINKYLWPAVLTEETYLKLISLSFFEHCHIQKCNYKLRKLPTSSFSYICIFQVNDDMRNENMCRKCQRLRFPFDQNVS